MQTVFSVLLDECYNEPCVEEKTCSVQNGRCTCNQGLHSDGTGNCVGKFTHYKQLVLNHLSGQFHIIIRDFGSKATDGQIITGVSCKV